MPGSTSSRSSRNPHSSLIPMSERQQLKLVRQLETGETKGGSCGIVKGSALHHPRSRNCNGRGETPLHKAAIKGDEELVRKLLEEGADPNVHDFAGWTPLHEACNHGWLSIALALIEAGASVNARGLDDYTPLHDAAINGHVKLVQLLVEQGADVNSQNKSGKTPCDVAAPGLIPHLLQTHFADGKNPTIKELKLHQVRDKSLGKQILEGSSYVIHKHNLLSNMEDKNIKEDVYEFKSSKEATPVRGNSASPEIDKNVCEIKNDKSEGYSSLESEPSSMKRFLSEVVDNEETEDETKKKKRKEGDNKVRDEMGNSSKILTSVGRVPASRNSNTNSEKGGKLGGHVLCKNSSTAMKAVASNVGAVANAERKSPGSPKNSSAPCQHSNSSGVTSNIGKTEPESEEKSSAEGEKLDQGPKVPPLKIVIPQQTASEPEQGNRNGKNGTSRHHQALPYVVSSNSNDSEKEGMRSRSASPTDSFKFDEKKDPAIGMLSAEDQKSSLHHQRVLRSSNRSGPVSNSESRGAESLTPRTGNGNGSNPTSGTISGPTSSSSNPSSGTAVASNDDSSLQPQNRSSSPQVDSNLPSSVTSGPSLTDNSSIPQNSTFRSSSTTPNKTNGTSSSGSSNANYEDKTAETNAETNQSSSQGSATTPAPVELHPRKRKLKHNKEVKEAPVPQTTNERCESTAAATDIHPHEQPVKNCYQLFLDIRKQIERRRKGLFPVQPKPPQGFKDYLMNRCTYVLAGNASTRQIPSSSLPQNLTSPMKDLFSEQEKERHRLRLQHVIEKEKLVLSVEQEILRVHGRAARALANQSLPFSVCTILKDEEVYNLITPEQEEKDRNARSRYNGRLFLSWLQDVDDKWEKIKEAMLLRHHNEAESLHAVQKMDWEWKLKELESCEFKSKPVILENHVPMVHVSDDFDLLPA